MSRSPSTVPKDLCINIELKQRKTNNDWNKKDVVSTLPYTAFRRLPTYYYYYYNYLPLVSTGRQILFCSVLCCGSVVLWVHLWVCPSHKMALSMDQMFYNSPLIALLHFWPWKVRGQGQRCKNRENAEIVLLAVTLPQMVRFTLFQFNSRGAGTFMPVVPHTADFLVIVVVIVMTVAIVTVVSLFYLEPTEPVIAWTGKYWAASITSCRSSSTFRTRLKAAQETVAVIDDVSDNNLLNADVSHLNFYTAIISMLYKFS